MVNLTIDGRSVQAKEGTTILQAATDAGIYVPRLCYWKDLNEIGACRMCVVEVEGTDRLAASCDSVVEEGMVVRTDSPRVVAARKTNLQLILSQHNFKCGTCSRNLNCELQTLVKTLKGKPKFYGEPKLERNHVETDLPLVREADKCVKCMRCVQVCDKIQTLHTWSVLGYGSRFTVGTTGNVPIAQTSCTYCGQCVTHCPVGALSARDDTKSVKEAIDDPELTVVVQVSSAAQIAWGEEFGVDTATATSGKLAAALRKVGFKYVFNGNFAADLAIVEEANELIERLAHRDQYRLPAFTSSCPGWINFIKRQFPAFVPNLLTAKPSKQVFGAIFKGFFAEKLNLDPRKVRVVSISSCMANKSEFENDESGDAGRDVDYVLTTREAAQLIKDLRVPIADLPEEAFDEPFSGGTGAGAIVGASGGMMNAVLRSAYYFASSGQNTNPDAFREVRGILRPDVLREVRGVMRPWKEATFTLPNLGSVRVAVVSGLGNARGLMEALERSDVRYDFVEVMACPGGCVGGGGQPIHDCQEHAEERGLKLWEIDSEEKQRFAHENEGVRSLYSECLDKPFSAKAREVLHIDRSN